MRESRESLPLAEIMRRADFVKAISDPKHPEHDEMLEWVGGKFDPEAFDLRGINGMLELFRAALIREVRRGGERG